MNEFLQWVMIGGLFIYVFIVNENIRALYKQDKESGDPDEMS